MSENSRLLALGPQSVSVQAADYAVLGTPLDTEGRGESGYQRQDETAAEDYPGQRRMSGQGALTRLPEGKALYLYL